MFSGLYSAEYGPFWMELMTLVRDSAYSGLQVDEDCPGNIVLIVRLVEEHVLAIVALAIYGVLFEDAG